MQTYSIHTPDKFLIEEFQRGSDVAFTYLYERYKKSLLLCAYTVLGNWTTAEDATQNAFIKIWQALKRKEDVIHFKAWACKITRNQAVNIRKVSKPTDPLAYEHADIASTHWYTNTEQVAHDRLEFASVQSSLKKMGKSHPKRTLCIELLGIYGFPERDIVHVLGIKNRSGVSTNILRGRRTLKKMIA